MSAAAKGLLGAKLFANLTQGFLISIGAFSVWWGISTYPIFWHDSRLEHAADSIINGERFKTEILQALLASSDPEPAWARPETLRSIAIIQLSLVEQAIFAEKSKPSAPVINQLSTSIRRALSAAPADPLLWIMLFLSKRLEDDHSEEDFACLRMSYHVGPHEGWVASRRNSIVLGRFTKLPQDLAEEAVTEFKDLVVSGYYNTAVRILLGPGWPIHELLLHRLEDAPEAARRRFAQTADRLGYEIAVPGIVQADPRPWQ